VLPSGLLSANAVLNGGSGKVTLEGWVRVTGATTWGRIFDFGDGVGVEGKDYLMLSASIGTDVSNRRTELRNEDPGGGGITTVDHPTTGFNRMQHFAVTWDEATGQIVTYEDGLLKSSMTVDDKMSDISDVNCWLGRSNWTQDNDMQGDFDEFRVYDRILDTNEMALNIAVGTDNNFGSALAVRLFVTNTLQAGQSQCQRCSPTFRPSRMRTSRRRAASRCERATRWSFPTTPPACCTRWLPERQTSPSKSALSRRPFLSR
jgi:hypothetical protein